MSRGKAEFGTMNLTISGVENVKESNDAKGSPYEAYSQESSESPNVQFGVSKSIHIEEKCSYPKYNKQIKNYNEFDDSLKVKGIENNIENKGIRQFLGKIRHSIGIPSANSKKLSESSKKMEDMLSNRKKMTKERNKKLIEEMIKQQGSSGPYGGYAAYKRKNKESNNLDESLVVKGSKEHPGFKAVQSKIADQYGGDREKAGAILASRTRKASAKAKANNPNLSKVKGKGYSKINKMLGSSVLRKLGGTEAARDVVNTARKTRLKKKLPFKKFSPISENAKMVPTKPNVLQDVKSSSPVGAVKKPIKNRNEGGNLGKKLAIGGGLMALGAGTYALGNRGVNRREYYPESEIKGIKKEALKDIGKYSAEKLAGGALMSTGALAAAMAASKAGILDPKAPKPVKLRIIDEAKKAVMEKEKNKKKE